LNCATSTYSSVVGGCGNKATGYGSFVGGGLQNSACAPYSFIGAGNCNTTSGIGESVIVAGTANTSSGYKSFIGAGRANSSSSFFNFVGAGCSNNASGGGAIVVGGTANNATNDSTFVGGGVSNCASGFRSSIIGGQSNTSFGDYSSVLGGLGGRSYLYGQGAFGSGNFSGVGDAQSSQLVARRRSASVTTGTTLTLSLDGTGTTNLIIPEGSNRAWNVTVKWVAVVTAISGTATGVTVGDYMVETNTFGFKRVGGTSSITAIGTSGTQGDGSITGTALMTYTAGASQQLSMVFTAPTYAGGGTLTMQVVAKVELTENSW
jgi:hypothetical protein